MIEANDTFQKQELQDMGLVSPAKTKRFSLTLATIPAEDF